METVVHKDLTSLTTENIIEKARELALGTRLKRLSDHFYDSGDQIYKELGFSFQSRWFPVVFLLHNSNAMGITEIANLLGQTHPAISQISKKLEKNHWIESITDPHDSRRRLLQLSKYGREQIEHLLPVWQAISASLNQLLLNANADLLDNIKKIEKELPNYSFTHDVIRRVRLKNNKEIKIVNFAPEYCNDFKYLNYQWLEKYFQIESHDEKVLSDPQHFIIEPGGHIFFALIDKKVVGTCALIHNENRFELSKMAVSEEYRGLGIGEKLASHAINVYKNSNKEQLYLESNIRLKPALILYEKLGFKHQNKPVPSQYQRANVYMVYHGKK